jgi:spore coat protein U-like protein
MARAVLHALCLCAAIALNIGSPLFAATDTATFQVTIAIQSECQITSANNLDFGTKGILAANVDATATLSVQCTNTTAYEVGLDEGLGVGATVAARKMTGPGAPTVTYTLFTDAARTSL